MAQLPQHHVSTLILGAGAAGMMAAAHSGAGVLVIDHAKAAGEKIRISGGGRCNFTNIYCDPSAFLSENPHFAKSALSRYGPYDFLDLVNRHRISWHEKTLGQLFCDTSAKEIIAMLRAEMTAVGAELWLETSISSVRQSGDKFCALVEKQGQAREIYADHLIVATGGKSIPKMGATGLAYQIAETFGHRVTDTRPALVPFTFDEGQRARFAALAGLSLPVRAKAADAEFDEAMLFTHRGLSGPAKRSRCISTPKPIFSLSCAKRGVNRASAACKGCCPIICPKPLLRILGKPKALPAISPIAAMRACARL
jgi:hypothetical protein